MHWLKPMPETGNYFSKLDLTYLFSPEY